MRHMRFEKDFSDLQEKAINVPGWGTKFQCPGWGTEFNALAGALILFFKIFHFSTKTLKLLYKSEFFFSLFILR